MSNAKSPALHVPVMLKEILQVLSPSVANAESQSQSARYFDGTFGRGGHLRAMLQNFPKLAAVAVDRDPDAILFGQQEFAEEIKNQRLQLFAQNFADFDHTKLGQFDVMLVDLGVSSPQLDEGRRGFSFYHDGPLDMRMDNSQGHTAAEVIAAMDEEDLANLFKDLGEIQRPYRVVRAIVSDREKTPFTTTRQLASLIERVEGWHRKGFHPATQYFMALRLHVNQELGAVESALRPLILGLKPRGRLAILTFHSLEDRIVKNVFRELTDLGAPVFKKVVQPEWAEQKVNPRARSAKLRIFERSDDNSENSDENKVDDQPK